MIEIYLFINPLGGICLEAEKKVIKLIATENKKIQFRLLPFVNFQTVSQIMNRRGLAPSDLEARNTLFETLYAAALDFKALQLQGNRIGRRFLMLLQEEVAVNGQPYTSELANSILKKVGANEEMFANDRQSQFVRDSFTSDQQIAREMKIVSHPSAVVYNYSCDRDFGILVEGCESYEVLQQLCENDNESYHTLLEHSQDNNTRVYLEKKKHNFHLI